MARGGPRLTSHENSKVRSGKTFVESSFSAPEGNTYVSPRNSRGCFMIRAYENPLVSLNKAGYEKNLISGGRYVAGGGVG